MQLDIILRTHSLGNLHAGRRFATDSKEELIFKCTASLIRSANEAKGHDIRITVVDDHSSESCIAGLKRILATSLHPASLVHLEAKGHGASLLACYEYARDFGRDILYFIEDDYLHFPNAISEMLEAYGDFKNNLGGREVGLLANDDPDAYRPAWLEPCRIVLGRHRHWRTNLFSTSSFMLSKAAFLRHWDVYMLHTHYGENYAGFTDIQENVTVDKVWRGDVTLFTPIPALAFHMQFQENIAPFADWQTLWNSIDLP